jgi:hypothetical protein
MSREDIIKWAREAGIDEFGSLDERLIFFAALVAAAEREACAKVCENDFLLHYDPVQTQTKFIAAIRARGQE